MSKFVYMSIFSIRIGIILNTNPFIAQKNDSGKRLDSKNDNLWTTEKS